MTTRSGSSSSVNRSTCSSTMTASSSARRYAASVARPSGGKSEYLIGRQNGLVASVSAGRMNLTRSGRRIGARDILCIVKHDLAAQSHFFCGAMQGISAVSACWIERLPIPEVSMRARDPRFRRLRAATVTTSAACLSALLLTAGPTGTAGLSAPVARPAPPRAVAFEPLPGGEAFLARTAGYDVTLAAGRAAFHLKPKAAPAADRSPGAIAM